MIHLFVLFTCFSRSIGIGLVGKWSIKSREKLSGGFCFCLCLAGWFWYRVFLCNSSWPQTPVFFLPQLPSPGILGVCHHDQCNVLTIPYVICDSTGKKYEPRDVVCYCWPHHSGAMMMMETTLCHTFFFLYIILYVLSTSFTFTLSYPKYLFRLFHSWLSPLTVSAKPAGNGCWTYYLHKITNVIQILYGREFCAVFFLLEKAL